MFRKYFTSQVTPMPNKAKKFSCSNLGLKRKNDKKHLTVHRFFRYTYTLAALSCLVSLASAAIAPGQNAYLPPDTGYKYPKPPVPFPPTPGIPPSRPPSPPRPPAPTPPRPTYGPPTPPYRPPSPPAPTPPRPTYGPPSPPYRPPSPPAPTPPRPTYGPPTPPPFRPSSPSPPIRPTPGPRPTPPQPYIPPVTAKPPPFRPTPPRPSYGPPPPPGKPYPPPGVPQIPGKPPRPGTPPPFQPDRVPAEGAPIPSTITCCYLTNPQSLSSLTMQLKSRHLETTTHIMLSTMVTRLTESTGYNFQTEEHRL
nr:unnamed protein product [Callosobruchus chinensis]